MGKLALIVLLSASSFIVGWRFGVGRYESRHICYSNDDIAAQRGLHVPWATPTAN